VTTPGTELRHRRTKIIATLGPATDDPAVLQGLIDAGVDVVRLNFSHGDADQHRARAERVRAMTEPDYHLAILGDLQGPKIRIARFRDGPVTLAPGDPFTLDPELDPDAGDAERVGLSYAELAADVAAGDELLLDDGRIVLRVREVAGGRIRTETLSGGVLSDAKGLNRAGGGLAAPSITPKDLADIKLAAEIGVDFLAVSYPRSGGDIYYARELLREAGGVGQVVAKIERAEAVANLDDILEASDAIMVARGDLGVEVGDPELPALQKSLIRRAWKHNRVAITATQMMESMITSSIPTRAEVFDVANAVLDGTDAVMLSAETAVGANPVAAVLAMSRICAGSEPNAAGDVLELDPGRGSARDCDEAIAMAAIQTANHLQVKAIAALTESGSTPRQMSRFRCNIPIYAVSRNLETRRRVNLFRGVYPVTLSSISTDHAQLNRDLVEVLAASGVVADGDRVIITKGDLAGVQGGTNALKIVQAGAMPEAQGVAVE